MVLLVTGFEVLEARETSLLRNWKANRESTEDMLFSKCTTCRVGLWRSWERASMAWKRSTVRTRPGPPNSSKTYARQFNEKCGCGVHLESTHRLEFVGSLRQVDAARDDLSVLGAL